MISAEELLKPISDQSPCGEDLYYDPSFQELESLMKGKAETQFSAAEDPDWKAVRERCLETHFTTKRDNALYEGYNAGMGLGLSFVAVVLEHHQAVLTIESEPLSGTTFVIRFPKRDHPQ